MSSSSPTSGTPASDDDQKSHTFRKRRLSLSRHHIARAAGSEDAAQDGSTPTTAAKQDEPVATTTAAAAAAAVAAVALGNDDGEGEKGHDNSPFPAVVGVHHHGSNDDESAAGSAASDHKAQTFRKRRLSLTLKKPDLGEAEGEAEEDNQKEQPKEDEADYSSKAASAASSPAHKVAKASEEQQSVHVVGQRPRRASDASIASRDSYNTSDGLKVRTLHADEIIPAHPDALRCPPSPALDYTTGQSLATNSNNHSIPGMSSNNGEPHVLYRQSRPSTKSLMEAAAAADAAAAAGGSKTPQPKWKKRIVRKHDEDERKLPFPRDIVGTYSCHGVEPVYESDYDHTDEDEEDDEDDWTEDISGEKSSHNRAVNRGVGKVLREPKPSTAAKINQDRGGVAFPYGNCPRTALFAAYDGM